ncbi:uncharacterized protein LOC117122378 [Anneissia japonica]|uniref:uncharacterized protein LOC117122378 n=1 Tax=Anneissia japonica TaxID=1529436 RepID=UPI0014259322|nr:uncharacterized protein LOC117122378 [Anneissia japonica]
MRISAPAEHVINVHITHLNLNHGVGNHGDSYQEDDDDVCFNKDTLVFSEDNSEDVESIILCGFEHDDHENVRSSSTFMRIVFQSNGNRDDSGTGYNLSISFLAVCEENLERYRFGLITVLILFILLIIFFVMLLLKWRPKAKKTGSSSTSEIGMENVGK